MRIFIVDDDRDFAESMAEVFKMRGYDVETAASGEEAVRRFKEKDFDVAFMDVKMPGKNGVQSFLEIRKLKPHTKVIMMTGYSVEQLLEQAVENGDLGVLHKPLNMKKVLGMVREVQTSGVVLIADDDPDFAKSVKELLEDNHYTVSVVHNGQDAVDLILRNGIDVVILDLRMPVLNGLEVYMELKRKNKSIPALIVTAYPDEEMKALDSLRAMSQLGILTKPFDPRKLIEAVENLVKEVKK